MGEISKTGFWSNGDAHLHHVNCEPLGKWIIEYLKGQENTPVYDFGCGLGYYLKMLQDAGFQKLTGFEGDPARLKMFDNIITQDLTVPFTVSEKGNCIFLEVAEHIPAEFEDIAVNNVTSACSNKLIMSWGVPGQAGHGHVNCLDPEVVIEKITKKGFKYLDEETKIAKKIDLRTASWFQFTLLMFEKINE